VQAAAKAALDGLVSNGTITRHQEDLIDAQVNAGSVDPQQLVSSGVISASQMSAVNNALIQVKQSFAASAGSGGATSPQGAGDKTGSSDVNAQATQARLQAAVKAALDGLVTNGTINQHQEDVIDAQVNAGQVDPQQLVSSGVISASQMSAVNNALIQVKQSFANG
jgi:competence protein ComGC